MKTILITASSTNNVIGQDNAIPWYLPEDLKQFKKMGQMMKKVGNNREMENLMRSGQMNDINSMINKNKF